MIEIAGLFGMIAFVVASLAVGIRILLLARSTRLLPETTIGFSLLLAGGVSPALLIAPLFMTDPDPKTTYLLYQFGSAISHVGYLLLFVFVWRVFRREEIWASILFAACTAGLVVGGVGMALEIRLGEILETRYTPNSVWFWLSLSARFVGYCWATTESLGYYSMLKKRLHLGLADASVVSRFLCWGISLSAVVCIWISTAAQQILADSEIVQSSARLIIAVLGFVVAGFLWAAFFPMGRSRKAAASGEIPDPVSGSVS